MKKVREKSQKNRLPIVLAVVAYQKDIELKILIKRQLTQGRCSSCIVIREEKWISDKLSNILHDAFAVVTASLL